MSLLWDRMFVGQTTLERWIDDGVVEVSGNHVHLPAHGRTYFLEPAQRLLRLVSGTEGAGAVGKVLSDENVMALGGEILGDSVMFGELAFEVEPGWIATAGAEH